MEDLPDTSVVPAIIIRSQNLGLARDTYIHPSQPGMMGATLFMPHTCSENQCSAPRSYTLLTFVVLMVVVSLCPGEVGMHGSRHVLLRTDIESRKTTSPYRWDHPHLGRSVFE